MQPSFVELASWLLALAGTYLALGIAFALPFAFFGAGKIDPAAKKGSWGFRLLIIPGVAAFWPLLALRWMKGCGHPPEERNRHRQAARSKRESA